MGKHKCSHNWCFIESVGAYPEVKYIFHCSKCLKIKVVNLQR